LQQTADWWSLGVLLFEMLTGSAPFRAKNRALLQKKILTEKIKYPTFLTSAAHKLLLGLLQRDEVRHRCRRWHGAYGACPPCA
jgi:p70 ribosomal S6 kinase